MARHSSQPAAGRSLATDSRIICSAHACPGQSRCLCCLQVFHRCRGQQLYTSRCIFMTRVTSRENKSFVSHRFCFAPNCRAAAEHLAEIHHPIPSCFGSESYSSFVLERDKWTFSQTSLPLAPCQCLGPCSRSSSESRAAASGRIIGTEDRPVTRKSLESRARPVIR